MTSVALPLRPSAKQDGCFGRAGHTIAVPNVQVRTGSPQVIFLTKYDDNVRHYAEEPNRIRLKLLGELGDFRLHRYITVQNPIHQFTVFHSFSNNLEVRLCEEGFIGFDNDRRYTTIIQFAHVGRLPGFAVYIDVRGDERSFNVGVIACRYNENLVEKLMENTTTSAIGWNSGYVSSVTSVRARCYEKELVIKVASKEKNKLDVVYELDGSSQRT